MTPLEVVIIILQLIFLEGILSIDNAAVLGAMVAPLPVDKPIPWPKQLHFMAEWGDRVFGPQRKAALTVGLLGAYAGRGVMLLLATYIIANPWLRLLGAAYLFKLAIDHLGNLHDEGEDEEAETLSKTTAQKGFWMVVLLVNLADMAFSLDNVVAAVALSSDFWVVFLGVAIGILIMRFAAQIFTLLIEKEPVLSTAAYLLVLAIGVEVLISDITLLMGHEFDFGSWQKFGISLSILILAVIYAHAPLLQRLFGPIFALFRRFFFHLNNLVNLLLFPLSWLFKKIFLGLRFLFRQIKPQASII